MPSLPTVPSFRPRTTRGLATQEDAVSFFSFMHRTYPGNGLLDDPAVASIREVAGGGMIIDRVSAIWSNIVGPPGDDGEDGEDGVDGLPGDDLYGPKGDQGPIGDPGDQGDAGPAQTEPGARGDDGADGPVGIEGEPGADNTTPGADGDRGPTGPPGADLTGPEGPEGPPGPAGAKLAIVPIQHQGRTEYRALHVLEAPRFEFIEFIHVEIPAHASHVIAPICPRYLATLDPTAPIEIRSIFPSHLAATLHAGQIQISNQQSGILNRHSSPMTVRIILAGLARGHARTRYPEFTAEQAARNAAFWASALTGEKA
jgi:hypothetical protein